MDIFCQADCENNYLAAARIVDDTLCPIYDMHYNWYLQERDAAFGNYIQCVVDADGDKEKLKLCLDILSNELQAVAQGFNNSVTILFELQGQTLAPSIDAYFSCLESCCL